MGSKGRILPPHLRRPLPGPGIIHPDPYGSRIHPQSGAFPPFDMLPPQEAIQHKLAAQHVEIEKLAVENQRFAVTHDTLRKELAAAQHEKQILHVQTEAIQSDSEQRIRGLMDKIAKIENELKSAEPIRLELHKARTEAEKLVITRQELIAKVLELTQDLQRAHADAHYIPALISELDTLRQEYHRCRMTYDYEKKLYNDHLESLQVMEKNYMAMAGEVEKLRAELTNIGHVDPRTGGPYGGVPASTDNDASRNNVGQNPYDDGYGIPQGGGLGASASIPTYAGVQSGPTSSWPGYDAQNGPGNNASKVGGQVGPTYDPRGGYNHDMQRHGYDTSSVQPSGSQVQVPPANNTHTQYASAMPSTTMPGNAYEAYPRGGNAVRR